MEVSGGAKSAVVPGGVGGDAAHSGTVLALGDETAVHGGAELFDLGDDERIEIVIKGIAERGDQDHTAAGPVW